RYGAARAMPPSMQMPLAKAMQILSITGDYTEQDVLRAFRRAAKRAHPDLGGTAEKFRLIVEARDRLLAALGTSAPDPPDYAPSGAKFGWRTSSSSSRAIGAARYLLG